MSARRKNSVKRKAVIALIAIAVIFIILAVFANSKNLPEWDGVYEFFGISTELDETADFVRIMDVGQGDSILICSNGSSALIDTGPPDSTDMLCSDIYSFGIRDLDLIMLTHFHDDHSAGIDILTERFSTHNLLVPDVLKSDSGSGYPDASVKRIEYEEGGVYLPIQGMSVTLGDFEITILGYYSDINDENNRSIFAMAEIDGKRFLFTGDAEEAAEENLLKEGLDLDCDVLKVGHHGSQTSSSEEFLDACKPEYAAISCGVNNPYSHPHDEVLDRLKDRKAQIYRTDMNGNITFYVEDGDIRVETEK